MIRGSSTFQANFIDQNYHTSQQPDEVVKIDYSGAQLPSFASVITGEEEETENWDKEMEQASKVLDQLVLVLLKQGA